MLSNFGSKIFLRICKSWPARWGCLKYEIYGQPHFYLTNHIRNFPLPGGVSFGEALAHLVAFQQASLNNEVISIGAKLFVLPSVDP